MTNCILDKLMERYPALLPIREQIERAYLLLESTYSRGGKVFCCGNGGSCADGEHIVGELMKSFMFRRKIDGGIYKKLKDNGVYGEELAVCLEGALPAIALSSHPALTTAFINDTNPLMTYAQQLYGLGRSGDALIAVSTSGNSKNCMYAAVTAHAMDIPVIAMTGASGGRLAEIADVSIQVPASETYQVQEYHLPVYHCLCAMLEARFFTES